MTAHVDRDFLSVRADVSGRADLPHDAAGADEDDVLRVGKREAAGLRIERATEPRCTRGVIGVAATPCERDADWDERARDVHVSGRARSLVQHAADEARGGGKRQAVVTRNRLANHALGEMDCTGRTRTASDCECGDDTVHERKSSPHSDYLSSRRPQWAPSWTEKRIEKSRPASPTTVPSRRNRRAVRQLGLELEPRLRINDLGLDSRRRDSARDHEHVRMHVVEPLE